MYTFAHHAKRCYEVAQAGQVLRQYVQVKVAGVTACGRIQDCWTTPEGVDLWRIALQPPHCGISSYTPSRVRQCSGLDGRCICAREAGADQPACAAVGAGREGVLA